MARHHDRDRVVRACLGDSPECSRLSDFVRDLTIGAGFTRRNRLQCFPNAALKRGRPDIERQIDPGRLPIDVGNDPFDRGRQIGGTFRELCRGKFGLQALSERFRALTDPDRAQTIRRARDQERTELSLGDGVLDLDIAAAITIGARGHPELGIGSLVQPAG